MDSCCCFVVIILGFCATEVMNTIRRKKLFKIIGMLMAFGISSSLVLYALRENISLYYTPSELEGMKVSKNQLIRIGGVVVKNSVQSVSNSTEVQFSVSDAHHTIQVQYNGVLPTLFRVGQTIVAQGYLQKDNLFRANQVLAKHGEDYHAA